MNNVKEKKVEPIELFYDLIYIYAISKLTLLLDEPVNGVIPMTSLIHYIVVYSVILQVWLYLTNYINRYGQWKWYEYLLTIMNMIAAVFMTNTISSQWILMARTFNSSLLIMLLTVAGMYGIQFLLKEQDIGTARNSFLILCIDCLAYFMAFIASIYNNALAIWIDIAAVLIGIFLPFFIRGNFDMHIISFPHLFEQFELITMITFGEAIVSVTDFFTVPHFSFRPVFVFLIILALFGCYVIQIYDLCDHHRNARALRLMFTHYFIIISVNLVTAAFRFLGSTEANDLYTAGIMILALALFFISIYADSPYYYSQLKFTDQDINVFLASFIMGALIMLLGHNHAYVFLMGALIIVYGSFVMLLKKYTDFLNLHNTKKQL